MENSKNLKRGEWPLKEFAAATKVFQSPFLLISRQFPLLFVAFSRRCFSLHPEALLAETKFPFSASEILYPGVSIIKKTACSTVVMHLLCVQEVQGSCSHISKRGC